MRVSTGKEDRLSGWADSISDGENAKMSIDKPTDIHNTQTMPTETAHKPPTLPTLLIERVEVATSLRGIERTLWLVLATLGILTLIDVAQLWLIAFLLGHVR